MTLIQSPMPRPSATSSSREAALRGVRALVHALQQTARRVEERTGLTNAQLFLLRQIADAGELSVNELVARAHAGQSAVSAVVGGLARRGLVRRARSAADGRQVLLSPTPAARRLVKGAPEPPAERLIEVLNALPDADVRALVRGLTALLGELHVRTDAPRMLFDEEEKDRVRRRARRGRG